MHMVLEVIYLIGYKTLKGRRQRVSVNSSLSGWTDAISDTTKISLESSATFINDLPLLLRNKVIIFADNTKI